MQSTVSSEMFLFFVIDRRIFFLRSRINSVEELHGMGLFLNDLNPHGLSKEMVMAGWQHCSR